MKNNLIDSDSNMCLKVNSLIEKNSIITGSNNVTLKKVNINPYGFDKTYMDIGLIEDKLYQTIDKINQRKTTLVKFYSIMLNEIHHFYDRNSRTCKILFANDDTIKVLLMRQKFNLFCIKCLVFTKVSNIKTVREIDGTVNLYSRCIKFGFKKF